MAKQFTYATRGLRFEWGGGNYIDIFVGDDTKAIDCYNVWDYEKDVPTIERSIAGLVEYVNGRLAEADDLTEKILG
jgi:hypothetical protein